MSYTTVTTAIAETEPAIARRKKAKRSTRELPKPATLNSFDARRVFTISALAMLFASTLFVVVRAWYVSRFPLPDDALITIVYARSLAEGSGFVFNHPPATAGTTTPFWAMVLAIAFKLLPGVAHTVVAVFMSEACRLATAWSFVWFRRAFGLALWEAALIGATGILVLPHHMFGAEAEVFQLLLVLGTACVAMRRYWLAGLLAGLLALTRPEGLAFVPVALAASAFPDLLRGMPGVRRQAGHALLMTTGFAVIWVPWSIAALSIFGRVLPNTVTTKFRQGEWQADTGQELFVDIVYKNALACFNGVWRSWGIGHQLLFYTSVVGGLVWVISRRPRLLPIPLWALAFYSGYAYLEAPGLYIWYIVPLAWTAMLCAAMGGAALLNLAVHSPRFRPAFAAVAGLTVLALFCTVLRFRTGDEFLYMKDDVRSRQYEIASQWLNLHAANDASVACSEIGYLGYFTRLEIIDLVGLLDPRIGVVGEALYLAEHKPHFYVLWPPVPFGQLASKVAVGRAPFVLVAPVKTRDGNYTGVYQRFPFDAAARKDGWPKNTPDR